MSRMHRNTWGIRVDRINVIVHLPTVVHGCCARLSSSVNQICNWDYDLDGTLTFCSMVMYSVIALVSCQDYWV